jgi:hypothetical protein
MFHFSKFLLMAGLAFQGTGPVGDSQHIHVVLLNSECLVHMRCPFFSFLFLGGRFGITVVSNHSLYCCSLRMGPETSQIRERTAGYLVHGTFILVNSL